MLDDRNRELAEVTQADDFIVSDRLISLMLSQLSENEKLTEVFDELFNSEGSEVYLAPAENYVKLGTPLDFYTVSASASKQGETAIGFRIGSKARSAADGYGVIVRTRRSPGGAPTRPATRSSCWRCRKRRMRRLGDRLDAGHRRIAGVQQRGVGAGRLLSWSVGDRQPGVIPGAQCRRLHDAEGCERSLAQLGAAVVLVGHVEVEHGARGLVEQQRNQGGDVGGVPPASSTRTGRCRRPATPRGHERR